MNKAIIVGNLTRDPELKTTANGIAVTTFTVAAQRRYKTQDGQQQADFINCVAWRGTAEFIAKYFVKGQKIGVSGSIQTRTYDDANGVRKYVTEVNVEDAEFVTSKSDGGKRDAPATADGIPADAVDDFEPLDDADLPF